MVQEDDFRSYREMIARKPEERLTSIAPASELSVVEVLDRFLGGRRRVGPFSPTSRTSGGSRSLIDSIPASLPCPELKPYHLTRVMDAKERGANRKSNFAGAVNRAMDQGMIGKNPVAHVEKPARQAREIHIALKEYEEVMANLTEPNFSTRLDLAWEAGPRVQVLRDRVPCNEYRPEGPSREAKKIC